MSAAANAAGYLYASGRIKKRKEKAYEDLNKAQEPVKPVPVIKTSAPVIETKKHRHIFYPGETKCATCAVTLEEARRERAKA